MNDDRNILSRWSARKAAVRRGEAPAEPADEAHALEEAREHAATPEQALPPDAAPVDDETPALPSIDELNAESDYTVFLKEKVPEQLRRAALRKLWTSDPVLANLDGLNDYDEDFTLATTALEAVQSAWQAGRGYADEAKEKLDKVDEALGGSDDAPAEPRQAELQNDQSQAEPGPPRVAQEAESLGESDAAGDKSADAPRQAATVTPASKSAHTREQGGE